MKDYLKEAGNIHLSYYIEAADILDIKYEIIVHKLLARFEHKGNHWFIINTVTPLVNSPGKTIAVRKGLTNLILNQAGIPVPEQKILLNEEDAINFWQEHKNIVVKPEQGIGGKGICILPREKDRLISAFQDIRNSRVIGEKYVSGKNYRLLTLGENVIATAERLPAKVAGNGKNNIKDLILNENPKVPLDSETQKVLNDQGLSLESIPEAEKVVYLRSNTNLTTGGTTRECLNELHPYYKEIAAKAIKAVGLEFGGVDLIAEDITKPGECAINEINYNPGLRIHYQVDEGEKIKVAIPIMKYIRDKKI